MAFCIGEGELSGDSCNSYITMLPKIPDERISLYDRASLAIERTYLAIKRASLATDTISLSSVDEVKAEKNCYWNLWFQDIVLDKEWVKEKDNYNWDACFEDESCIPIVCRNARTRNIAVPNVQAYLESNRHLFDQNKRQDMVLVRTCKGHNAISIQKAILKKYSVACFDYLTSNEKARMVDLTPLGAVDIFMYALRFFRDGTVYVPESKLVRLLEMAKHLRAPILIKVLLQHVKGYAAENYPKPVLLGEGKSLTKDDGRPVQVERHRRVEYVKVGKYYCAYCQLLFPSKIDVQAHIETHFEEEYKHNRKLRCGPVCGQDFETHHLMRLKEHCLKKHKMSMHRFVWHLLHGVFKEHWQYFREYLHDWYEMNKDQLEGPFKVQNADFFKYYEKEILPGFERRDKALERAKKERKRAIWLATDMTTGYPSPKTMWEPKKRAPSERIWEPKKRSNDGLNQTGLTPRHRPEKFYYNWREGFYFVGKYERRGKKQILDDQKDLWNIVSAQQERIKCQVFSGLDDIAKEEVCANPIALEKYVSLDALEFLKEDEARFRQEFQANPKSFSLMEIVFQIHKHINEEQMSESDLYVTERRLGNKPYDDLSLEARPDGIEMGEAAKESEPKGYSAEDLKGPLIDITPEGQDNEQALSDGAHGDELDHWTNDYEIRNFEADGSVLVHRPNSDGTWTAVRFTEDWVALTGKLAFETKNFTKEDWVEKADEIKLKLFNEMKKKTEKSTQSGLDKDCSSLAKELAAFKFSPLTETEKKTDIEPSLQRAIMDGARGGLDHSYDNFDPTDVALAKELVRFKFKNEGPATRGMSDQYWIEKYNKEKNRKYIVPKCPKGINVPERRKKQESNPERSDDQFWMDICTNEKNKLPEKRRKRKKRARNHMAQNWLDMADDLSELESKSVKFRNLTKSVLNPDEVSDDEWEDMSDNMSDGEEPLNDVEKELAERLEQTRAKNTCESSEFEIPAYRPKT